MGDYYGGLYGSYCSRPSSCILGSKYRNARFYRRSINGYDNVYDEFGIFRPDVRFAMYELSQIQGYAYHQSCFGNADDAVQLLPHKRTVYGVQSRATDNTSCNGSSGCISVCVFVAYGETERLN